MITFDRRVWVIHRLSDCDMKQNDSQLGNDLKLTQLPDTNQGAAVCVV